jgi:hypothetical protein
VTVKAISRSILALALGVALLAGIVALVPSPMQILAALIVLPIESLLVAVATSIGRGQSDRASPQLR